MKTLIIKDFDLAATVRSGHLFCYDELGDDTFCIVNSDESFVVQQQIDLLHYSGISEKKLRHFFDLDLDVDALHRRLGERPLRGLLKRYRGIRLVRQDARQAILSFILSSNNNQKRIKKMVDSLRHRHGEKIGTCPLIPPHGKINSLEDLDGLRYGYRARFIVETERILTKEFLRKLRVSSYEDARALLLTLPGVGPKVADCVLAYSELAKGEAFPADVWVKRAVQAWYEKEFGKKAFTDRNIQEFARKKFGTDAAYAQHYLFLAAQAHLK